ncbi:MAG: hypothetical protein R2939_05965 [Kofleriaceae bacterium]
MAFVDVEASHSGDGLSWETALATLDEAFALGVPTVFVKAGTITATSAGPLLTVPAGVHVAGGVSRDATGMQTFDLPRSYTVLDGAGLGGPVVAMPAGGEISGLTVRGGTSDVGGGVLITGAGAAMTGVWLDGNQAAWGGGLACLDAADVQLRDLTLTKNVAAGDEPRGGGAYLVGCTGTFATSVVDGNAAIASIGHAAEGGGLYLDGPTPELAQVEVLASQAWTQPYPDGDPARFAETLPVNTGGGVYLGAAAVAHWDGVVVRDNVVTGHSLGSYLVWNGDVTMRASGESEGAGVYVGAGASFTFEGLVIQQNEARPGTSGTVASWECVSDSWTCTVVPQEANYGYRYYPGPTGAVRGGGLYRPGSPFDPEVNEGWSSLSSNQPTDLEPTL